MFSEKEAVLAETPCGYKINNTTYRQAYGKIKTLGQAMSDALSDIPKGSIVGLYMNNSLEWIESFWALLMCGYSPLLMNARMTDELLCKVLTDNNVSAVVSEGKSFSVKTLHIKDIFDADNGREYTSDYWGKEVVFMSSGTSENVKLCAYTAENFYYQLCISIEIVKEGPAIAEFYEGKMKLLALLPFYHVFGFIANYMWFGFFSSTFVFLPDLKPQSLLMTIQKDKVTHIFAVPLVWETIYKEYVFRNFVAGNFAFAEIFNVFGF
jgi:long-subunit acyl-CoA synthetase (AMP-forming)